MNASRAMDEYLASAGQNPTKCSKQLADSGQLVLPRWIRGFKGKPEPSKSGFAGRGSYFRRSLGFTKEGQDVSGALLSQSVQALDFGTMSDGKVASTHAYPSDGNAL